MNSLKRHNKANKPKDAIIMTKYNIVKYSGEGCRQKIRYTGNAIPLWMRTKNTGISMADGTASRANASGVAAGLHSNVKANTSIPML